MKNYWQMFAANKTRKRRDGQFVKLLENHIKNVDLHISNDF